MSAEQLLQQLRSAIEAKQWKRAGGLTDRLRLAGWRYSQFVELFGAEWEGYAQEMDEAETQDDRS